MPTGVQATVPIKTMNRTKYNTQFYRLRAMFLSERLRTLCPQLWVFKRELRLGSYFAFDEDVLCNPQTEVRATVQLAKEIYRCERLADDLGYPDSHRRQHEIEAEKCNALFKKPRENSIPSHAQRRGR